LLADRLHCGAFLMHVCRVPEGLGSLSQVVRLGAARIGAKGLKNRCSLRISKIHWVSL
jgi:hypothetical protein